MGHLIEMRSIDDLLHKLAQIHEINGRTDREENIERFILNWDRKSALSRVSRFIRESRWARYSAVKPMSDRACGDSIWLTDSERHVIEEYADEIVALCSMLDCDFHTLHKKLNVTSRGDGAIEGG